MVGQVEFEPGVTYARAFAETDGRGPMEASAYQTLVRACGEGQASSVRAMGWFLYWGSYSGNTLNGMMGRKKGKETSLPFKVFLAFRDFLSSAASDFCGKVCRSLVRKFVASPCWFCGTLGLHFRK